MRNERIDYKINNFANAVNRLKEAILLSKDNPLGTDAVIKRFEFTFEMAWKSIRAVLEYEGVVCKTPRECIKRAYELDYIDKEDVWLCILDDRNLISHIYGETEAELICKKIENIYSSEFEKLSEQLKEKTI